MHAGKFGDAAPYLIHSEDDFFSRLGMAMAAGQASAAGA
jgi:hypothetical protein